MPPPVLSGIGSDDEDDDGSAGPSLQMPPALAGIGLGSDDEDEGAPPSAMPDPMSQTAFLLSQSGAFKTADFQIRKEGGLSSIGEGSPTSDRTRPAVRQYVTAQIDGQMQRTSALEDELQRATQANASVCETLQTSRRLFGEYRTHRDNWQVSRHTLGWSRHELEFGRSEDLPSQGRSAAGRSG